MFCKSFIEDNYCRISGFKPICNELEKGAATITREDEMTIACQVPKDFDPKEVFVGTRQNVI